MEGSFDYQYVRAGDYVLFAVDLPDLEYANPAALRSYLASANPVRIEPRGLYIERISLSGTALQK